MDENVLGKDVQNINILTVIASESYEAFAKGLQSEMAEAVADRPQKVDRDLFLNRVITNARGEEQIIDSDLASTLVYDMIKNDYIDKHGILTDKYYEDKKIMK